MGVLSYWIQSYSFPISICIQLEQMCATFLWKDKMHAWSMSAMYKPKLGGGIGLRSVFDINRAASIKRFWNCCTSTSVWATWMQKHYCKNLSMWKLLSTLWTHIWKDTANVRQIALWHRHQEDSGIWVWTASPNGQFSFFSAWNIVRSPSQPFDLCNTVWFPSHSPKMACCLLRALND